MSEVITDNLDLWTSTLLTKSSAGRGNNGKLDAYGIKKLRELILELAVRGKLVPQDPNDEPASELLEKIAKEKVRLVRNGEIKKEKQLPEIVEEEKLFALPNGWKWNRLQDISSYIQRGKGPKYADLGKVHVVSQKCIQWSGFDLGQSRYVDDDTLDDYQPERFLRKGDLLWNSTGTGTVGRINVVPEVEAVSFVADSHVTVIRPLMINSRFICSYVSAPGIQKRIEPGHENSLVSGTTKQVELNLSAVLQLTIPVPPLAEQHRIVAKVDELMALCDQLEQQQTHSLEAHQALVETLLCTLTSAASHQELTEAWARIADHFDALFATEYSIEQLKQAILQLAVMGRIVPQDSRDVPAATSLKRSNVELTRWAVGPDEQRYSIPRSWIWLRFGGVGDQRLGKMLDARKNSGELRRYLRNTNVQWMRFDLDDVKELRIESKERDELRLRSGDLLICEGGEPGRCAIWNDQEPEMYYQKALHRVRPCSAVMAEYLALNLQIDCRNNVLTHYFTGATIKHLTGRSLGQYPIPIPPLAEQHRIVAKVDELMALCDALKARIADAKTTQVHLADAIVEQAIAV